jgi:hypothetical protein
MEWLIILAVSKKKLVHAGHVISESARIRF